MSDGLIATTRTDIISFFGLDVTPTRVHFEGWTPKKTYIKQIKITNLTTKTIHLEVCLPRTQFFDISQQSLENITKATTRAATPICQSDTTSICHTNVRIRGGHTQIFEIFFQPQKLINYDDSIGTLIKFVFQG